MMAEITQEQINQARSELERETREMSDALANRERYEKQAKALREDTNKKAAELEELSRQSDAVYRAKKQIVEALNATLRHAVVAKTVDDSARAQQQNEAKSAALLKSIESERSEQRAQHAAAMEELSKKMAELDEALKAAKSK